MNFFISAPTCETASLLHRGGCQSKSHLRLVAKGSLTRRIGLRPSDARDCQQRGGARGQMQKSSAGKFHSEPPFTSFDHLVGNSEQRRRNGKAEHSCGLGVEDQFELARPQDWKVSGLGAPGNKATQG